MLTQERVRELFDYKDGDLYWKIDVAKNIKAGRKAGVFDNFKYVLITINRKIYKAK